MTKGWFGNRQRHGLASKGVRSSFRRTLGKMHSKEETWELREEYIRQFGSLNPKDFERWVLDTTDKSPFHSPQHKPRISGYAGFGIQKVNKDNLVNYIMDYESGDINAEDQINLFSYLIKTGQAWSLQGHYGRVATQMIDVGYIDEDGNITVDKDFNPKPRPKKATIDKDLQDLYDNLYDVVDYKGKEFTQVHYGRNTFATEKYPTRSEEIIWEDKEGNQIYLFRDSIEYIPRGDY